MMTQKLLPKKDDRLYWVEAKDGPRYINAFQFRQVSRKPTNVKYCSDTTAGSPR